MSNKVRGLGKGLEALMGGSIPTADLLRKPVAYTGKDILRISMDSITANPFQPRENFDRQALEELSESIKALGLIQPVTVRRMPDGKYQIISGERRYRACRMAGMTTIPAYVRDADDQGMLEMALVENIQRQDLDPIETALSFRRLIDECSLTQEQLADRVGKKRASVANSLRLLKLPVKVQHDLKVGLITPGHAKALLGLEDPAMQEQLCDLAIERRLSVRELEETVRSMAEGGPVARTDTPASLPLTPSYERMLSFMGKYFSKDISIRRNASGKGSMTIRFVSDEELDRFLDIFDPAHLG